MKDGGLGLIVIGVIFLILIYILIKGLKFLKNLFSGPVTDQEALQAHINVKASGQPDGPGAGLKQKSSFAKLIWFLIACGLAYLLISGGILENILK